MPASAASAVALLDLKPQYQALRQDIQAAIARVCDSQYFILGSEVKQLEAAVAAYCQCTHGIGMSSGTDALLAALMALEIGSGDAVITSTYTFFATGGTIARAGARPLFCDIDPQTFNLSAAAVEQFIAKQCDWQGTQLIHRTSGAHIKALIPVQLYGQVSDMPQLMQLAQRYRLKVIEDAAQAIGAADANGKVACSYGDIGCLSFFPTKNLGAFGDAGMCVTRDPLLAERLRVLRVHGSEPKYYHRFIGGNFRLDELQAAVLNVKLPHLDAWSAARQRNAAHYLQLFASAALTDTVQLPVELPGGKHIYNQYIIRVERRDELRQYLAQQGVGTEVYYPVPLHLQECFAYLGYQHGDFPHAEQAAEQTLALPIYPELETAQLQHVVRCIAAFYQGASS
jgi:dTDP-4-amino-4,6-dideoxygalactose transaminase